MIDLLTSDPAIAIFSCVGLLATAAAIFRDTRTERERMRSDQVVTFTERQEMAA